MRMTYAFLGLVLIAMPFGAHAQKPAKLTAEQILEKSLAASGGRAAFEKIKTTTMKGTMNVKASGVTGTIEITSKSPDKVLVVSTMATVGEQKQGYDGKEGWSQDQFTGLRKLEGSELEEVKQRAQLNEALNYKKNYASIKLLAPQKVNGKDTYAIKMMPKTGKPSTSYFDTKTFMLVKQDVTAETPQGTFDVQIFLKEYKTVDGVKFPVVMLQKLSNIAEIEVRLTEIKNNGEVDDKIFTMPEEKKAEVKK